MGRILLLMLYDAVAVFLCAFLSLYIRFDFEFASIAHEYLEAAFFITPMTIVLTWVIFWLSHLYTSLWESVSIKELFQVVFAGLLIITVQTIAMISINLFFVPRSYHFMFGVLFIIFTVFGRFSYRFARQIKRNYELRHHTEETNIMLIGAGSAGRVIAEEVNRSRELRVRICCVIDDERTKRGKYLHGIPIIGGRERIVDAAEKYQIDQIILAIPSAKKSVQKELLDICAQTSCELKLVPGIYQMMKGDVSMSKLRNVEIEDLLGRDPIKVNSDEIYHSIQDKTILVTGGGGSIGSELCRQIAAHEPKRLILFDIYENNAYDIQQELQHDYPDLVLETIIGSVRDSRKIYQVFEQYRPEIVYHAAAHKHVPLMEDSPCEAIKNNVIGTYKTAFAAMTHGCERFVLISTDKAVNPTNIMGASKRLCEMVIQAFDAKIKAGRAEDIPQLFTHLMKDGVVKESVREALKSTKTEFVAVRFGNVLGSNGSVIPLFKKQLAQGGPITVTHPDIIRYFMTIPEAVGLVLEAGTYAKGGEIFVLDMGEPVKIDDLARNLIRCSGMVPDEDIKIVYTGLRPGEKLYEEKLMSEEGMKKTDNALIHIGCPIPFEVEAFLGQLNTLMDAAYKNVENMRELVAGVVETYACGK